MIKLLAIAALVSSAAAFAPAGKPATTTSALSAFENELGVQEPVSENRENGVHRNSIREHLAPLFYRTYSLVFVSPL